MHRNRSLSHPFGTWGVMLENKQSLPAGYVPVATYGGDLKKLQDLRDVGSLQAQVMLTAYCIAVLRSAVLDMGASSVPPFSRNSTGKSACRIPRHRSICPTMLPSHHSDILSHQAHASSRCHSDCLACRWTRDSRWRGWTTASCCLGGGDTRQEDGQESPNQSRISPSIRRILRESPYLASAYRRQARSVP